VSEVSTVSEADLARRRAASPAEGADGLDSTEFKQLFRQHPAGVAVITFAGPAAPMGFTATSVISVSAAPPVLAFAIAATSTTWQTLQRARTVLVNFL